MNRPARPNSLMRHLSGALHARPTVIGSRAHVIGVMCLAVVFMLGFACFDDAIPSMRLLAQRTIKQTARTNADPLDQGSDPLNNADWNLDEHSGETPAEFSPTDAEISRFRPAGIEPRSRSPLPLSRPGSVAARNLSLNGSIDGEESAAAEDGKPSRRAGDKSRTSIPWGTTIFSLLVITGLIVLCAWIVKKIQPLKVQGLSTDVVEVLGKRPLDPRQQIYLIRCGSRILVVGSSLQGMSTLAEITDPQEMDTLIGLCRKTTHDSRIVQSFQSLLGKTNWWQSARTGDQPLQKPGDASITRET
ncbi:MAG: FliO/MopB family protein [Planctomycetaceae bacterium]